MDCAEYGKSRGQLELAAEFMWARLLVPGMTLDAFLARYAEIAGMESPKDVIKRVLPPMKKDKEGGLLETSRQEFVVAYLNLIDECDAAGVAVPLTFEQFVTLPDVQQSQADGLFTLAPGIKAKRKKVTVVAVVSTLEGTRCVLTEESGPLHRGVVVAATEEPIIPSLPDQPPILEPVVFQADSGELFLDVMRAQLTPNADPPPRPHLQPDGTPKPIVQSRRLNIPRHEAERIIQVERAKLALVVVPMGEPAYMYRCDFGDYAALFQVINAQPVYVDANLVMTADNNVILDSLPPRSNLLGMYEFSYADQIYRVNVSSMHAGVPEPLAVSQV